MSTAFLNIIHPGLVYSEISAHTIFNRPSEKLIFIFLLFEKFTYYPSNFTLNIPVKYQKSILLNRKESKHYLHIHVFQSAEHAKISPPNGSQAIQLNSVLKEKW